MDAVTGATGRFHGPLQATWNCTDAQGADVPDGHYLVCMTFAEEVPWFDAGANAFYCAPFDRGTTPFELTLASDAHFRDIRLVMEWVAWRREYGVSNAHVTASIADITAAHLA